MLYDKPFLTEVKRAEAEKRRLVVPLVGFPGLNFTGCTVKLAQQNFGEHFKVVKAVADAFKPDAVFPLMLSVLTHPKRELISRRRLRKYRLIR